MFTITLLFNEGRRLRRVRVFSTFQAPCAVHAWCNSKSGGSFVDKILDLNKEKF